MPTATAANPQQTSTLFRVVRLVNTGERGFRGKFAGGEYLIRPGETAFVPWDAMTAWLGNPDAVDIDMRRRDRTDEYMRLRGKYGAYENDGIWEANKPRLEAYDAVTQDRIWHIVDDPEGHRGGAAVRRVRQGEGLSTGELQAAIDAMQSQMAAMQSLQAEQMRMMQRASGTGAVDEQADGTTPNGDLDERQSATMGAPVFVMPDDGLPADPIELPEEVEQSASTSGLAATAVDPIPDPTSRATRDEPQRPKSGPRKSS